MTKIGIMRGKTEVMKMAEIFKNFSSAKEQKSDHTFLKFRREL